MTLVNTVRQQEDELLISLIRRTADANGFDVPVFLENYVFDEMHEKMPASRELEMFTASNCYIGKFAEAINADKLRLFLDTCIYPGTAPFSPSYVQSRRINAAFRGCNLYPKLIGTIHNDILVLKYCPLCAAEDRRASGFTWLRRAHNMPNVTSCSRHGVDLITLKSGDFIRNGIPETAEDPTVSSDISVDYAVFADSLLKTPVDANWWSVRTPLVKRIDAVLVNKCSSPEYEELFGMSSAAFFSQLKKKNLHININTILTGLFAVYGDVASIEVASDEGLIEKFLEASKGNKVLSYSCVAAEILPGKGNGSYVTTPWGFLAGWRDPSDDVLDEDRKFKQIIRNITGGEIRPKEPFRGYFYSMDFIQRGTGKVIRPKVESVIEGLQTAEDNRRKTPSEADVRRIVEADGKYRLTGFTSINKPITIHCLSCGHTFSVKYTAWKKLQKCRICAANKQKANLIHYATKKQYDGEGYDSAAAFAEKMRAVTGTEYALVGEYTDIHAHTAFRHEKCGHVFTMTPNVFLNGGRCPKCRLPISDDFRNYIQARSNGQYSVVARKGSLYTIADKYTGREYTLKKQIIIREFERPGRSGILPVLAKTAYRRSKTNIEIFTDYLESHMPDRDLFTRQDIVTDDLTRDQVSHCIEKAIKKHMIERVGRGKYRYIGGSHVA